MRNWDKLENDEIFGIWHSYLQTEFPGHGDPLSLTRSFKQATRLTPMEIIKLVEELLIRLEAKKSINGKSKLHSSELTMPGFDAAAYFENIIRDIAKENGEYCHHWDEDSQPSACLYYDTGEIRIYCYSAHGEHCNKSFPLTVAAFRKHLDRNETSDE